MEEPAAIDADGVDPALTAQPTRLLDRDPEQVGHARQIEHRRVVREVLQTGSTLVADRVMCSLPRLTHVRTSPIIDRIGP